MKPTLTVGSRAEFRFVVESRMTVYFEGRPLHPFYSTYWLTYHSEYVSRLVLEPHLDYGEDGIGTGVFVRHHNPAGIGQELLFTAECTKLHGNYLFCEVKAFHGERMIGEGEVHQVVLSSDKLRELHRRAYSDWGHGGAGWGIEDHLWELKK